jgi:hypothetical protein
MYGFNYKDIAGVNLRWMRKPAGASLKCTITNLEALAEQEAILKDPVVSVGSSRMVLPVTLGSGDYVEVSDEGSARVFDQNGRQLTVLKLPDQPFLASGMNEVSVGSAGSASANLTSIVHGAVLTW